MSDNSSPTLPERQAGISAQEAQAVSDISPSDAAFRLGELTEAVLNSQDAVDRLHDELSSPRGISLERTEFLRTMGDPSVGENYEGGVPDRGFEDMAAEVGLIMNEVDDWQTELDQAKALGILNHDLVAKQVFDLLAFSREEIINTRTDGKKFDTKILSLTEGFAGLQNLWKFCQNELGVKLSRINDPSELSSNERFQDSGAVVNAWINTWKNSSDIFSRNSGTSKSDLLLWVIRAAKGAIEVNGSPKEIEERLVAAQMYLGIRVEKTQEPS